MKNVAEFLDRCRDHSYKRVEVLLANYASQGRKQRRWGEMMEREEKLKKAALSEEEEFGEANGGMRARACSAFAGTEPEQADGVTPRILCRRGAEPIDDEALEAVSGGLRVQST